MIESTSTIDNSNLKFFAEDTEMLHITRDGFYVRGVKLKQDEKEAENVYEAFHQWLTWAILTRNY